MKKTLSLRILALAFIVVGSRYAHADQDPLPLPDTATVVDETGPDESGENVESIENQLEKDVDFERTRLKLPSKKWVTPAKADYSKILPEKSYGDAVAIQKNFMPKSHRFQGSIGGSWLANDNFYLNFGGEARIGFHLDEVYGIEFVASSHSSSDTYKVSDLRDKQGIAVTGLVTPKSFIGGDLFFNTLYGKWAVNNRSISAFDIYQTIGAGKMKTTADTDSTAFFVGLGQMTSISRNQFWRLDLSWYFYNAKTVNGSDQSFNSLFLTVSWGGFFPTVGTRQ